MPYTSKVIRKVKEAEATDGSKLGAHALRIQFSVARIAQATGATRQTVYNWIIGKPVAPYYAERVSELLEILSKAETAEKAWKEACVKFSIHA